MFGPFGSGDLRIAARDGHAGRVAVGTISTLACACALVLLSSGTTAARAKAGAAPPAVRAVGNQLMLGKQPFQVYGFNYEFNGVHPNVDYIDKPTQANLLRLRSDFAEAARLGANTVRIFLELHDFLATPTQTRPRALRALRQILSEAERAGLLVDVTGNLAWHSGRSPDWYDALTDTERWEVQARFWRAVAAVGARSPSVLCYELTSEPAIADFDAWYGGLIIHHYVQYIVRDVRGRDPVALARAWTQMLRDAIRSRDRRHLITVGLLPFQDWAFDPANLADLLDLVTVHEYPRQGDVVTSVELIRSFARHGRPVLLGETFAFDRPSFEEFLLAARGSLAGSLSFYDGRAPADVQTATITDVMYRQNLISYLGLRTSLNASPPLIGNGGPDAPRRADR